MLSFSDQLRRIVSLQHYPKRIVSLVPSQTELLFDLGLNDEVVGITKFCIHPHHWYHQKTRVGGTKNLNFDIIHSLQPDLIIGNKEENVQDQVEELAKQYPVWISDVHDIETALEMITSIGELTNMHQNAKDIAEQIAANFHEMKRELEEQTIEGTRKLRAAYLIWKDPYMTVGGDTFIHALLEACGLENIFKHHTRYPEVEMADLGDSNCDLLLLSSEPYPFSKKHVEEIQCFIPQSKILLVDGQMFSWYGSRLLHVPGYLRGLRFEV